jgi:hypothetical protein
MILSQRITVHQPLSAQLAVVGDLGCDLDPAYSDLRGSDDLARAGRLRLSCLLVGSRRSACRPGSVRFAPTACRERRRQKSDESGEAQASA